MTVTLDQWAELLWPEEKGSASSVGWATVAYMNEDSSVQVRLNSSDVTTRCATWCKCSPGDRVLVAQMSKGSRCVIANYSTGTVPDGSITPDKLDEEAKGAIEAAERAIVATYEEFTATEGRTVPPAEDAVWTEDVPDGVSLSKVWKRLVSVWASREKSYGDPEPMQRLVRTATEYYLSSSRDAPEGGQWTEQLQEFAAGSWLFARRRADYACPATSEYGPPALDAAWAAAQDAVEAAGSASAKADAAQQAAEGAAAAVAPVAAGVEQAKASAAAAVAAAQANATEIASVKAGYATKSEVTGIQGSLEASISANAAAIESKVSAEEYRQNTEEANAAIAAAKAAADEAKEQAAVAASDLAEAQGKLDELEQSQSATASEIEAARQAVAAAQAKADAAAVAAEELASELDGLAGRVTSAEASISQTADSVETTVAKAEAAAADAEELAAALEALKGGELSGMAEDVEGLRAAMTSLTQDFEKIQMDFAELGPALEEGTDAAAAVAVINRYIRFVSGNIELGQASSPYRVVIRSDRISFMNADIEMAYMSGDKLFIGLAEVTRQLVVGDHSIESASPGHLTFKYIGE